MANKCKHFSIENYTCLKFEKYIWDEFGVVVTIMCPARPRFDNCRMCEYMGD